MSTTTQPFLYSSLCLGCSAYVRHRVPPEDEEINEHAYCDACLKELKLPSRGTYAAWRDSSKEEA